MKPAVVYQYRGMVERGIGNVYVRPGYAWNEGYSEDGDSGKGLFGWMTQKECRDDARNRGSKPVFVK